MLKNNQYTQIDDQQILVKTGKSSEDWYTILDTNDGKTKPSAELCQYLINTHHLSKYWARTIYIRYQWNRNLRTE